MDPLARACCRGRKACRQSDVENNCQFNLNSGIRLEVQDVAADDRLMTIFTQRRYFSKEYRCLSQKRPVFASSSILFLNPFLDQKGLIRAFGRVTASESLHLITLHGGNQLVVRLTRSRYWVPKIKNLVKAVISTCKVCVIH